jgi:protein-disulfide isomerase/type II secretory pathway component PulC
VHNVKSSRYTIAIIILSAVLGNGLIAIAAASNSDSTPTNTAFAASGGEASTYLASQNTQPNDQNIVAVIDGHKITITDLDASIRMQLHDLERARYKLRLQRLKQLIVERTRTEDDVNSDVSPDIDIFLEPPLPPRFELDAGNNEVRGNPGAPITIIQYLDFESPHSKRAQPVLHQLLEDYEPLVRLIVRDFPLPFHRHARQAALAAECARNQGFYWRYHDLLLQNQNNLDSSGLIDLAKTLGLDLKNFKVCLDNKYGATAVNQDIEAANKLGLHSTPVLFINGLYHKGPPEYSEMARLINHELIQSGILSEKVIRSIGIEQCPFLSAARSQLPLALSGTVTDENPAKSTAILQYLSDRSTRILRAGDSVLVDVKLVLITEDRIFLQQNNQLGFLPLSGVDARPDSSSQQDDLIPVGADAVLSLPRADVSKALKEVDRLESTLALGSLDLEGKHLLKLTSVETGGLFDLMGLQAKDVLMQVDGKWVHDQHNPLWEALRTQDSVTLTIMRKGFPKTFQYVIHENSE